MTTLYVLPEPDHYCIADDTWSFTRALVAAEIEKAYQRGRASMKAANRIEELEAENVRLREALVKLAKLGNEPYYGNSDGNMIARKALETT